MQQKQPDKWHTRELFLYHDILCFICEGISGQKPCDYCSHPPYSSDLTSCGISDFQKLNTCNQTADIW